MNEQRSRADSIADDEPRVAALVAYDEALRGTGAEPQDSTAASLPPVPTGARACLRFFERAWPRATVASGAPAIPSRIGRFEVERVLGEGGFGVVYLARDPRLGRRVALKIPRPHVLASPQLHERFLREARAAAALDHANIIPILETGESGPVCYIASAYCEGPTLAAWLKSQSMPVAPAVAARIVACLAEAVQYSHDCGVLHRDLKPSNVLLAPASTVGDRRHDGTLPFVPRLTDFGLAKVRNEVLDETGTSVLMGTPLYMAPEQAAGKKDSATPATDVYSLGVIFYELLTGRPPFQGTGFIDVLNQIQANDPVPPTRLIRSIPRDVETICLKCLAKEPARRYTTARELRDDLCAYCEGRVIAARPAGALEKTAKWVRRRPLAAALAFVVTAALTSLFALQWRHSQTLADNLETTDALRVEALEREAELRLQYNAAEINAAQSDLHSMNLGRLPPRLESIRKGFVEGRTSPPGLESEWNFVMRQVEPPPPELIFAGHEGAAYSVAVAPDGRGLATGDAKGTIRIWNLQTGANETTFTAHEGEVRALAFSPGGDRLASGGQFRILKIWDTTDWQIRHSVDAHDGTITTIDWRHDGEQIASGSRDGTIRLSRTNDLAIEQTVEVGPVVHRVRYSADGTRLYSSQKDNTVVEWGLHSRPPSRVERLRTESSAYAFDVSRGGRFVLTTGATFFEPDGRTLRLDANYQARGAVIARAGNWAATGGWGGAIDLWRWADDPFQGVSQQRWCGHGYDGISELVASPDGSRLITAGLDGLVKVWPIAAFLHPTRQWLNGHSADIHGLAFSHDDRHVASAGHDGRIRLYETDEGRLIDTLDLGARNLNLGNVRFGVDSDTLFASTDQNGGGLVIWQRGSSPSHRIIPTPGVNSLSTTSDGATLAVAFQQAQGVALWNTATAARVRNVFDPPIEFIGMEVSPDGRYLAGKPFNQGLNLIRLVDMATGACREIPGTTGPINGMCVDREWRTLAVLQQPDLRLYDVASGEMVDSFHIETGSPGMNAPCFSPDGQIVAFGSPEPGGRGGIVQLYHLKARRTVLRLELSKSGATRVQFSNDGRMLACVTLTPDEDGNAGIFLWRFDPPRGPRR